MTELYRKIRPTSYKQVVGQPTAIKTLQGYIKNKAVPHVLGFFGHTGTGKTTLARITAKKVGCDTDSEDFQEINAADFNGIETARNIRKIVPIKPMYGTARVWVLDEAHSLSSEAQKAFMKVLEEAPEWAYFFFCTTDPEKLIAPIKGRCQIITTNKIDDAAMHDLLERAMQEAYPGQTISEKLMDPLLECADGSARKLLQTLESIMQLEPADRLVSIYSADTKKQGIDLARLLMDRGKPSWDKARDILANLSDEPEKVRQIVLSYCSACMLKNYKPDRCSAIINLFAEPWFSIKSNAGLVNACYEAIHG